MSTARTKEMFDRCCTEALRASNILKLVSIAQAVYVGQPEDCVADLLNARRKLQEAESMLGLVIAQVREEYPALTQASLQKQPPATERTEGK